VWGELLKSKNIIETIFVAPQEFLRQIPQLSQTIFLLKVANLSKHTTESALKLDSKKPSSAYKYRSVNGNGTKITSKSYLGFF